MSPKTRLAEIESYLSGRSPKESLYLNEDVDFLIARVRKLEVALEFYEKEYDYFGNDIGEVARQALNGAEDKK